MVTINERCGERLSAVNEELRAAVSAQPVVCFDETGMSIGGELSWLHVASTELLTASHSKRGREAFAAIAILPDYGGTAVHDNWQSYFGYDCGHGLCNGHHLRELILIHEQYGQDWAQQLIELLLAIKGAVASAVQEQRPQLPESVRERFTAEYHRIINAGLHANPAAPDPPGGSPKQRGRKKQSKARNLLLRLASRWRQVLAFMDDFLVPFDNNQAERDLRMMKVQQKISGTFRSPAAAVAFCRTRSYISTIRKNSLNVLEALTSVFAGDPMTPPCLKPATQAE